MKDFRELMVWHKAHQLALAVYAATIGFPREEVYGLTAQIRRAAVSVPANLAEGCGRNGEAEIARFCSIAAGSTSEVEYHLLLSKDLHYLPDDAYEELAAQAAEVKRMLNALIKTLKSAKRADAS